ncbi:hypothetical protein CORC01_06495 [Colletotrichum orchidophilum]|uniref:Invertebrate defensins family profile domain-containing protein n=1 Tax=Colletotrichum orchidophilum TaxID=1209926 RepID=A0A1G4BA88_9PEZI|nr:uncharacterized protein CORC01_06495 [Colletotrichum orchidophilum]OHE98298.1 hypothetical protein CORC01_06495 [Colletotrichum orchidophilum]
MLSQRFFWAVAMACNVTVADVTAPVPFTWPPPQGSMSDFEYNLRFGCDFMSWCGGFDGGCAAECLRQGKQCWTCTSPNCECLCE